MDEEFNLQKYVTKGVENFVKDTLRATLTNPKQTAFMLQFAKASKRSAKIREKKGEEGLHVPAFIIASITSRCNLHCEGCYSRDTKATTDGTETGQLTDEQWYAIFKEAAGIGVSFMVLAGGEPMLRRKVIEYASKVPDIIFPVFTNGTYLDDDYYKLFNNSRNLTPVVSIEGNKELTDKRRGDGIFDKMLSNMERFKKEKIAYGVSITITKENFRQVADSKFVKTLSERGVKFVFFVEYVPVGGHCEEIAFGDKERGEFNRKVENLRKQFTDIVFVLIPGDEKSSGGCLAAGRGFFHINSRGGAEPCPMSPYSDVNIAETSIAEALKSNLFTKLRDGGLLTEDHSGGCVLAGREDDVRKILGI